MAPKRKESAGADELSGREKKKQKMAVARTIAVQSAKTVSFTENAEAGLSFKSTIGGIPAAIDVEKFAEARAFEIGAMHSAMKSASASSTTRAWQALPRHLRRRAASHDVRRVPLRLRDKARAEMDPIRKKTLGRSMPKLGKSKRVKRTETLLERQRDKIWLETHIWHAKRMKMENMWGYRLAVHPTEKAYRPSHRASIQGSILHDASYYSLIELKGPEVILKQILNHCCDPNGPGPGSQRYIAGLRTLETYIYKPGSYPFDLISPMTVIWKPLPTVAISPTHLLGLDVGKNIAVDQQLPKRKRKSKDRQEEIKETTELLPHNQEVTRIVWLRLHPSAFEDALASVQSSASATLEANQRQNNGKEFEVEIADLRGQVNAFEIMGPQSNQVLRGALTPVPQDQREEFKTFWSRLTNMQTSGELSRGTVIGFKVLDPRLKFPPKNAKAKPPTSDNVPATTIFPSAQLAQCEIWDEAARTSLTKPRYKKKDLDERRTKLLIPGTPLRAERQDDRIPVLLIQRSLGTPKSESQGIHGWTLIIPAGWSMAFFSSLTFTGTRVGGQRERQTQAFEAGTPSFPRDLPTSTGYEAYAAAREVAEKSRWQRKPPAKRPNYEKLGTTSPWKADWEGVLNIPRPRIIVEERDSSKNEGDVFMTTQREPVTEVACAQYGPRIWLLRGSEAAEIISKISRLFNYSAGILQEVNRLREKRGHEYLDSSIKAEDLIKGAMVSVQVILCRRGAPDDLAIIYSITDDEAKKWEKTLCNSRSSNTFQDVETPEEIQLSEIVPPESSTIGYLTSGHFSLSRGRGFGIGAIPLVKLLSLQEQSQRLHTNNVSQWLLLVKVRNRNGQQCRPAYVEILST